MDLFNYNCQQYGQAAGTDFFQYCLGKKAKAFPTEIAAGEHGEFSVYAKAGTSTGIEFYFTMGDKVEKKGDPHYGNFSFSVDMPYWKHANKSSFDCTGILTQSGFKKIPDGAHDFAITATVSTSLCSIFLPGEKRGKATVIRWNIAIFMTGKKYRN